MVERSAQERRILAVYLPEFLCELALGFRPWSLDKPDKAALPMGVILAQRAGDVRPQDKLAAVCARAFCRGVRPGQTPAEANVTMAGLRIFVVEEAEVESFREDKARNGFQVPLIFRCKHNPFVTRIVADCVSI